jgi:hypothetical protein
VGESASPLSALCRTVTQAAADSGSPSGAEQLVAPGTVDDAYACHWAARACVTKQSPSGMAAMPEGDCFASLAMTATTMEEAS